MLQVWIWMGTVVVSMGTVRLRGPHYGGCIVRAVGPNTEDPSKPAVLKCAPSGSAANLIDGQTMHSLFSIPANERNFSPDLSHSAVEKLQTTLKGVRLLIIDEYSMVGLMLLARLLRLRAGVGGRRCGHSLGVVLVGDIGRVPPVFDKSLWSVGLVDIELIEAALFYQRLECCIQLIVSNRSRLEDVPTRPLFEAFDLGLRTGEMSMDTWQRVMDHCSEI